MYIIIICKSKCMCCLQETQCVGSRHRFAVPHQKAAIRPSTSQQLFGSHAADVPMIPLCCCHGDWTHKTSIPKTPKVHLLVSRIQTKLAFVWLVDPSRSTERVTLKNDITLSSPPLILKHA